MAPHYSKKTNFKNSKGKNLHGRTVIKGKSITPYRYTSLRSQRGHGR